jgi:hypothetical protein
LPGPVIANTTRIDELTRRGNADVQAMANARASRLPA